MLGLLVPESGDNGFGRAPLWALFAVGCAVAVTVGAFTPGATSARLGVTAGAALAAFWLLLVLPGVASQTGFLQTAGCALSCGATWLRRPAPATGS